MIIQRDQSSTSTPAYSDGSEEQLLALLKAWQGSLGADSSELLDLATDWPTEYHLSHQRADALRLLNLDSTATVLEIGCGCGAITRYLGEQVAQVVAIEPMPARAAVARERTRDLDTVDVRTGMLDEVDEIPAFDVVLVWGVLEYVANGSNDDAPYVAFLRSARKRLAPGGQLVIAIENPLGVKYLCGSYEDHTARPFDSVEGYPRTTPARTFDRRRLQALLEHAGLHHTRVLQALPDYKMTRVLISDELLDDPELRHVAWEAGTTPSPDRAGGRWRAAAEDAAWRSFVRAGLGGSVGNSFVVIASTDPVVHSLWPTARRAGFVSTGRAAEYRMRACIEEQDNGLWVLRQRVLNGPSNTQGPISHSLIDKEPFLRGSSPLELIREGTQVEVEELITQWREAIDEQLQITPGLLDLALHNFRIVDGSLVSFDQEWVDTRWSYEARIGRLAFLLALDIIDIVDCERWPAEVGVETVEDLMYWIAAKLGLTDRAWVEEFVEREATFGVAIGAVRVPAAKNAHAVAMVGIRDMLVRPLESGRLSIRRMDQRGVSQLRSDFDQQSIHVRNVEAAADVLQAELTQVYESRLWRFGERIRHVMRYVRPRRSTTT